MSFTGQISASRVYNDFILPHQLVHEEEADILLLELPGFTKEQIRVQIDKYGKIRISGQRPLSDGRWSRFRKDYISEDFNVSDIRAKFENNILSIFMPKLINKEIFAQDEPAQVPKPTASSDAKVANDDQLKPNAPIDGIKERVTKEEKEKEIKEREQSKEHSKDKQSTDEKAHEAKEEKLAATAESAPASDGSNRKNNARFGFQLCRTRKISVLKLATPVLFFVGMGLFLTYKLRRPTETESLDVY